MPAEQTTERPSEPVQDSIPKVNNEVAVGSDMEFQERWWRFERILWIFYVLIVVAALLGCFGRGPLAKGRQQASDNSISVQYDRVARYSTPSKVIVQFGPAAADREGRAHLWLDKNSITTLGLQRISPQPEQAVLAADGIVYTFPVSGTGSAELFMEPPMPGVKELKMRVPGSEQIQASVIVMP